MLKALHKVFLVKQTAERRSNITTLSEKEKRAVAAIIQERLEEHLGRFPYARYPAEPLEDWHKVFCDPISVLPEPIKKALV
ncbi:hypothetical protein [Gorillibacterium massiliense]|uniref:hypothetical protein n=1 Tax=Gorillibacterium massiliense TaxID=1280390 RepID=UPI0004B1589D|nr:hypothetical protein [Gorillibacterium massiliense]